MAMRCNVHEVMYNVVNANAENAQTPRNNVLTLGAAQFRPVISRVQDEGRHQWHCAGWGPPPLSLSLSSAAKRFVTSATHQLSRR